MDTRCTPLALSLRLTAQRGAAVHAKAVRATAPVYGRDAASL